MTQFGLGALIALSTFLRRLKMSSCISNNVIYQPRYSKGVDARITAFPLVVRNKAEALEYYTEKVGFEKKTDYAPSSTYRYVSVGPRGQDLELALWQVGTPDPTGWINNPKPGSSPPIVLRVEDCRRTFAEMRSRGVEFKQAEPEEYAWGITATFSDPDGNLFSVNQFLSNSPW